MTCPICGGPITWDKSHIEELLGFEVMEDPDRPGWADHHYACLECGRVQSYLDICCWWPESRRPGNPKRPITDYVPSPGKEATA